jgi:hypothetical protein
MTIGAETIGTEGIDGQNNHVSVPGGRAELRAPEHHGCESQRQTQKQYGSNGS